MVTWFPLSGYPEYPNRSPAPNAVAHIGISLNEQNLEEFIRGVKRKMYYTAHYYESFWGWKIYQTNNFNYYARKGSKWIHTQPSLGDVKQLIIWHEKNIPKRAKKEG